MEYETIAHEDFVASLIKGVPGEIIQGEVLTPTQKLIVRLRGVKESRHLTIPQIEEMVNKSISRTTLYRFFEDNSETKYQFLQYTIETLMTALLVDDTRGDDLAMEKVGGFEAALQLKDEIIASCQHQIEQIKADHERKCQEYEARLALWQHQIEKKDERMDRKDRILDEKDGEIRELRARVDELTKKLMEKCGVL